MIMSAVAAWRAHVSTKKNGLAKLEERVTKVEKGQKYTARKVAKMDAAVDLLLKDRGIEPPRVDDNDIDKMMGETS